MTFVYEHISDEDKKRIDFSKITVLGHEADPYRWVIDRGLNAFLIRIIQDREPPHEEWYAFYWQNKIFSVGILEQNRVRTVNDKWAIPVKYRILLQEGILSGSPELTAILSKIEEAIQVEMRGSYMHTDWGKDIVSIQVKYSEIGDIK